MAGKAPQSGPASGGSGKRPAIAINTNFDEPPRAQVMRAKAAADRSDALPTTRSNTIVWSVVAIVLGLPVIAVIWLVAMPEDDVDRYPKARAIEARNEMAIIATKAQAVFSVNPDRIPASPTPDSFAVTTTDLGGEFEIRYQMSFDRTGGTLTIFAPGMFADMPQDLIMVVNLRTGTSSVNREPPR